MQVNEQVTYTFGIAGTIDIYTSCWWSCYEGEHLVHRCTPSIQLLVCIGRLQV